MANSNTVTTQTKLPGYLETASKEQVEKGKTFRDRPYPAYTGPRIADLTGDQTTAFDLTRSAIGKHEPFTDFASRTWTTPGVAESCMNPYMSEVIGKTTDEIMRNA